MLDLQCNSPHIFSGAFRLQRADGFGHVINAENISNSHFKLFFSRSIGENARLGIVASKKILPKAVDRNSVKRFIRESFRHHNVKFCKLDLVVMIRRDFSQGHDKRIDNLERLFSQVEKRCADF